MFPADSLRGPGRRKCLLCRDSRHCDLRTMLVSSGPSACGRANDARRPRSSAYGQAPPALQAAKHTCGGTNLQAARQSSHIIELAATRSSLCLAGDTFRITGAVCFGSLILVLLFAGTRHYVRAPPTVRRIRRVRHHKNPTAAPSGRLRTRAQYSPGKGNVFVSTILIFSFVCKAALTCLRRAASQIA